MESGHLRRADNRWLLTEPGSESGRNYPLLMKTYSWPVWKLWIARRCHVLQAAATLGEKC